MDRFSVVARLEGDLDDYQVINKINNNHFSHLKFTHGSFANMHCWSFTSQEQAEEAKQILENMGVTEVELKEK